MTKISLDQRFSPYQMPCSLIGTIVDKKPNFMVCTWLSRVNRNPPVWMVSINRKHHTMKGIRNNQVFSINFPSVDLVKEVDYCGITSGREIDKSKLFNTFYGETKAPMIKECTLSIELNVDNIIDFPDHFIIFGNAVNSYIDGQYLTDGKPNIKKMNPIVYTGAENQNRYWSVGEKVADAFKIGKEFKKSINND
ncbi:MAG: flavin reductase family protein [Candidatus Hodarchaeales archaeon]